MKKANKKLKIKNSIIKFHHSNRFSKYTSKLLAELITCNKDAKMRIVNENSFIRTNSKANKNDSCMNSYPNAVEGNFNISSSKVLVLMREQILQLMQVKLVSIVKINLMQFL